jgi:hypothetical protein
MSQFLELPLELLPVILDFVVKPQHISTLCLVNKSFNDFAMPLLYRRVFIFAWYKEAKSKVSDWRLTREKLLNITLQTGRFAI